MSRITTLTDTRIKHAKSREKEYKLAAGHGLQLRVKPNGSKLWLFNYTKPHTGMGGLHLLSACFENT